MSKMRLAVLGAGFWARYQLSAWRELPDVECVALADLDRSKAERLAAEFSIENVFEDPRRLVSSVPVDVVDVITDVHSHAHLVELAAEFKLPVICQKPLGPSLEVAQSMVRRCDQAGVPLFVHENWRWQAPIRALKGVLDSGRLGTIIRGRIDYANSFPVFDNQPFLKELEQFILTDIGTHILDVARLLWGEADQLYCQTRRIRPDIRGEDVATVLMRMSNDVTVTCNMSYASKWELDRFPETFVAVEGSRGGVSLGPDYTLTIVTDEGTEVQRVPPHQYSWADPAYALIHASIVGCNRNLLQAIRGQGLAETTGKDNLRTLQLVFAAYESASRGQALAIDPSQIDY
jgi:D-apiose dehydrogenase